MSYVEGFGRSLASRRCGQAGTIRQEQFCVANVISMLIRELDAAVGWILAIEHLREAVWGRNLSQAKGRVVALGLSDKMGMHAFTLQKADQVISQRVLTDGADDSHV